jgi:predicted nucleotidyltransferase
MDIEKQIDYWEKSAEHDLDTAKALIKKKKYDWVERKVEIIETLKKLVNALKENKITISEAYLFGSYANDSNTDSSDIDVALVSDAFTGVRYFDIKKIGRIVRNIDYRIEVHPFSPKALRESMFLDEIIRTGIRVA